MSGPLWGSLADAGCQSTAEPAAFWFEIHAASEHAVSPFCSNNAQVLRECCPEMLAVLDESARGIGTNDAAGVACLPTGHPYKPAASRSMFEALQDPTQQDAAVRHLAPLQACLSRLDAAQADTELKRLSAAFLAYIALLTSVGEATEMLRTGGALLFRSCGSASSNTVISWCCCLARVPSVVACNLRVLACPYLYHERTLACLQCGVRSYSSLLCA
jgi:hypothetical protein